MKNSLYDLLEERATNEEKNKTIYIQYTRDF